MAFGPAVGWKVPDFGLKAAKIAGKGFFLGCGMG
jgi:hypothetical protein